MDDKDDSVWCEIIFKTSGSVNLQNVTSYGRLVQIETDAKLLLNYNTSASYLKVGMCSSDLNSQWGEPDRYSKIYNSFMSRFKGTRFSSKKQTKTSKFLLVLLYTSNSTWN